MMARLVIAIGLITIVVLICGGCVNAEVVLDGTAAGSAYGSADYEAHARAEATGGAGAARRVLQTATTGSDAYSGALWGSLALELGPSAAQADDTSLLECLRAWAPADGALACTFSPRRRNAALAVEAAAFAVQLTSGEASRTVFLSGASASSFAFSVPVAGVLGRAQLRAYRTATGRVVGRPLDVDIVGTPDATSQLDCGVRLQAAGGPVRCTLYPRSMGRAVGVALASVLVSGVNGTAQLAAGGASSDVAGVGGIGITFWLAAGANASGGAVRAFVGPVALYREFAFYGAGRNDSAAGDRSFADGVAIALADCEREPVAIAVSDSEPFAVALQHAVPVPVAITVGKPEPIAVALGKPEPEPEPVGEPEPEPKPVAVAIAIGDGKLEPEPVGEPEPEPVTIAISEPAAVTVCESVAKPVAVAVPFAKHAAVAVAVAVAVGEPESFSLGHPVASAFPLREPLAVVHPFAVADAGPAASPVCERVRSEGPVLADDTSLLECARAWAPADGALVCTFSPQRRNAALAVEAAAFAVQLTSGEASRTVFLSGASASSFAFSMPVAGVLGRAQLRAYRTATRRVVGRPLDVDIVGTPDATSQLDCGVRLQAAGGPIHCTLYPRSMGRAVGVALASVLVSGVNGTAQLAAGPGGASSDVAGVGGIGITFWPAAGANASGGAVRAFVGPVALYREFAFYGIKPHSDPTEHAAAVAIGEPTAEPEPEPKPVAVAIAIGDGKPEPEPVGEPEPKPEPVAIAISEPAAVTVGESVCKPVAVAVPFAKHAAVAVAVAVAVGEPESLALRRPVASAFPLREPLAVVHPFAVADAGPAASPVCKRVRSEGPVLADGSSVLECERAWAPADGALACTFSPRRRNAALAVEAAAFAVQLTSGEASRTVFLSGASASSFAFSVPVAGVLGRAQLRAYRTATGRVVGRPLDVDIVGTPDATSQLDCGVRLQAAGGPVRCTLYPRSMGRAVGAALASVLVSGVNGTAQLAVAAGPGGAPSGVAGFGGVGITFWPAAGANASGGAVRAFVGPVALYREFAFYAPVEPVAHKHTVAEAEPVAIADSEPEPVAHSLSVANALAIRPAASRRRPTASNRHAFAFSPCVWHASLGRCPSFVVGLFATGGESSPAAAAALWLSKPLWTYGSPAFRLTLSDATGISAGVLYTVHVVTESASLGFVTGSSASALPSTVLEFPLTEASTVQTSYEVRAASVGTEWVYIVWESFTFSAGAFTGARPASGSEALALVFGAGWAEPRFEVAVTSGDGARLAWGGLAGPAHNATGLQPGATYGVAVRQGWVGLSDSFLVDSVLARTASPPAASSAAGNSTAAAAEEFVEISLALLFSDTELANLVEPEAEAEAGSGADSGSTGSGSGTGSGSASGSNANSTSTSPTTSTGGGGGTSTGTTGGGTAASASTTATVAFSITFNVPCSDLTGMLAKRMVQALTEALDLESGQVRFTGIRCVSSSTTSTARGRRLAAAATSTTGGDRVLADFVARASAEVQSAGAASTAAELKRIETALAAPVVAQSLAEGGAPVVQLAVKPAATAAPALNPASPSASDPRARRGYRHEQNDPVPAPAPAPAPGGPVAGSQPDQKSESGSGGLPVAAVGGAVGGAAALAAAVAAAVVLRRRRRQQRSASDRGLRRGRRPRGRSQHSDGGDARPGRGPPPHAAGAPRAGAGAASALPSPRVAVALAAEDAAECVDLYEEPPAPTAKVARASGTGQGSSSGPGGAVIAASSPPSVPKAASTSASASAFAAPRVPPLKIDRVELDPSPEPGNANSKRPQLAALSILVDESPAEAGARLRRAGTPSPRVEGRPADDADDDDCVDVYDDARAPAPAPAAAAPAPAPAPGRASRLRVKVPPAIAGLAVRSGSGSASPSPRRLEEIRAGRDRDRSESPKAAAELWRDPHPSGPPAGKGGQDGRPPIPRGQPSPPAAAAAVTVNVNLSS
eukprot:tig00021037_g17480.t1